MSPAAIFAEWLWRALILALVVEIVWLMRKGDRRKAGKIEPATPWPDPSNPATRLPTAAELHELAMDAVVGCEPPPSFTRSNGETVIVDQPPGSRAEP